MLVLEGDLGLYTDICTGPGAGGQQPQVPEAGRKLDLLTLAGEGVAPIDRTESEIDSSEAQSLRE